MAMSKTLFAVVAVLAIAVGVTVGYLIGYFAVSKDCRKPERWTATHAEVGSEDIEMLPSGDAIVTSGLVVAKRELTRDTWPEGIGSIKTFNFSRPSDGATDLTTLCQTLNLTIFTPHGISKYKDESSDMERRKRKRGLARFTCFVVNHGYLPDMKESIEIFQLNADAGTLTHLETRVDDVNFKILNNLVATGPSSFYFTNFYGTRVASEQLADPLQHTGSVGYHDAAGGRLLLEDLAQPNGIHTSPDGRFVYVMQVAASKLSIFRREENDDLVWVEDYALHSFCDNVVAQGEYLWLGCHPVLSAVLKHLSNPAKWVAPSQVLRLKVADGHVIEEIEVFADDGRLISTSSVALRHADGMLVGSVATKLLYCQIDYYRMKMK